MKILLLSLSDSNGAGKASIKIRNALIKYFKIVDIWVFEKNTSLPFIYKKNSIRGYFVIKINRAVSKLIKLIFKKKYKNFISYELLDSNIHKKINESNYDVVQLNWVNNFITIRDIKKINKKIVWRFSDMWPYLGLEHFQSNKEIISWKNGFVNENIFFNLDYKMWKRKSSLAQEKMFEIIVPSEKTYNDVKLSYIYKNFSTHLIRTAINEEIFFNNIEDREKIRKNYELPLNDYILFFSSIGGVNDRRKGWSFIQNILNNNKKIFENKSIIVIGKDKKLIKKINGCKVFYLGRIDSEQEMCNLYNASNIVLIPSIVDNLPQVGLEAQMCGIPVLTFNIEGLKEIVEHKKTGYLSEYMDEKSFLNGLEWISNNIKKQNQYIHISRIAKNRFSINKISSQLNLLYKNLK